MWGVGVIDVNPVFTYCFTLKVMAGSTVVPYVKMVEGSQVCDSFLEGCCCQHSIWEVILVVVMDTV